MTVCLSKLSAWFYFTGKPKDDETGLYYYGARYYDPRLGRFITADSIVQSPGANPQTFNRYSYCGNNPVIRVDPSGHWFTEICMFIASMGTLYNDVQFATGQISASQWGINLATTAVSMGTLDMTGASLNTMGQGGFLMKASAAASIASQAAAYAGADDVAKNLNYASQAMSGIFMAWNMGRGVKDWAWENRARVVDGFGMDAKIKSGSHFHINGIMTDFGRAISEAFGDVGADFLGYNPTSQLIADLTEATLGIFTGTSSVSRQFASKTVGLKDLYLTGYSHGGIIAGNLLVNLGLRNQRSVVSRVGYISTQIGQPRAYLSAALAGITGNNVRFTTSALDFGNILGPNINPGYFAGGVLGSFSGAALNAHGKGPSIYAEHLTSNPF